MVLDQALEGRVEFTEFSRVSKGLRPHPRGREQPALNPLPEGALANVRERRGLLDDVVVISREGRVDIPHRLRSVGRLEVLQRDRPLVLRHHRIPQAQADDLQVDGFDEPAPAAQVVYQLFGGALLEIQPVEPLAGGLRDGLDGLRALEGLETVAKGEAGGQQIEKWFEFGHVVFPHREERPQRGLRHGAVCFRILGIGREPGPEGVSELPEEVTLGGPIGAVQREQLFELVEDEQGKPGLALRLAETALEISPEGEFRQPVECEPLGFGKTGFERLERRQDVAIRGGAVRPSRAVEADDREGFQVRSRARDQRGLDQRGLAGARRREQPDDSLRDQQVADRHGFPLAAVECLALEKGNGSDEGVPERCLFLGGHRDLTRRAAAARPSRNARPIASRILPATPRTRWCSGSAGSRSRGTGLRVQGR